MRRQREREAERLFAPIAQGYERWSAWLSLGQDPRWRARMVNGLAVIPGARVLDVAAGTGLITRELERHGADVIALDLTARMLIGARQHGAQAIQGSAVALPFRDASFDALSFGYLLRYVDDPTTCLAELARVVRSGGAIGMVEFGRPGGVWGPPWWLYTRLGLPAVGAAIGHGWWKVGRFLGPSIDRFDDEWPPELLVEAWRAAGLTDVRSERLSLGGGLLMWGRRR